MASYDDDAMKALARHLRALWAGPAGAVTAGTDEDRVILLDAAARRRSLLVHTALIGGLRDASRAVSIWVSAGIEDLQFSVLRASVLALSEPSVGDAPFTGSPPYDRLLSSLDKVDPSLRSPAGLGMDTYVHEAWPRLLRAEDRPVNVVAHHLVGLGKGELVGSAMAATAVYHQSLLGHGRDEPALLAEQAALVTALRSADTISHRDGRLIIDPEGP